MKKGMARRIVLALLEIALATAFYTALFLALTAYNQHGRR